MFFDRVLQTTNTTGTGTLQLVSPASGYLSFAQAAGSGNRAWYLLILGTAWEIGWGVITAGTPDSLTRNPVQSTNGNGLINLTAAGATVASVPVASKIPYLDQAGILKNAGAVVSPLAAVTSGWTVGATVTASAVSGGVPTAFSTMTPVQQGGGISQGTNKIYIGWDTGAVGLRATVDTTSQGILITDEYLKNQSLAITADNQGLKIGGATRWWQWQKNGSGDSALSPLRLRYTNDNGSTSSTVIDITETQLSIAPNSLSPISSIKLGPHNIVTSFASGVGSVEVSNFMTGDRYSIIDLHSTDDASQYDYSARILRGPATTGEFTLINDGTGAINLRNDGSGVVLFSTAGIGRWLVDGGGNFIPYQDNAYSLGISGRRATTIWAVSGVIQTSDAREKNILGKITPSISGQLIDAVDPILFRWKIGGTVEREVGRQRVQIDPECPDSKYETVVKTETIDVPGVRIHAGFSAQAVKAAMDAAGLDFGAWGLTDKEDPDSRQWLRPDQLIPVLWGEVQSLRRRVAQLEAKG